MLSSQFATHYVMPLTTNAHVRTRLFNQGLRPCCTNAIKQLMIFALSNHPNNYLAQLHLTTVRIHLRTAATLLGRVSVRQSQSPT
jgi:hypothetical protein